jgi:bifunctional non-homologous end joining protein LigD
MVAMAKSARATSSVTIPTRRKGEPATLPAWVKPQLAALVKEAPEASDWLHEIKLDGYRMHARLDAGKVQILTRRGNDWTDKYPAVTKAIAGLPAQNAHLDGELRGVLPDGKTAFNLIRNATDTGQGSLVFKKRVKSLRNCQVFSQIGANTRSR